MSEPSSHGSLQGRFTPPLQHIACREIGQLKKYIHMDVQDGQDKEKDRKEIFISKSKRLFHVSCPTTDH